MGDQAVTSLYRKVVSPSVKFKTDELKKEPHNRHAQFRGQSSLAVRRLATSPCRSACSAPGRVESSDAIVKRSDSPCKLQDNNGQVKQYDFHPTTRFKTTSLPAMPMTSKYATQSTKGTSRTVALSVARQSPTSLPDKWSMADINPRILYTTQKQRQIAESTAKSECRRLKRKSEIIAHRVDKQYYLCGSKISVNNRFNVDTNDLLRLKLLAHHKQLAQYQAMKDAQLEHFDPRESPSGQMSSPTPSSARQAGLTSGQESPFRLSGSEGKWAEDTKSESSSVDDLDIIALRARKIRSAESKCQNEQDRSSTVNKEDQQSEDTSTETETQKSLADEDISNKEISKTDIEETVSENPILNVENQEENKTNNVNHEKEINTKPSLSKSTKKVKNLRFQDDVIKKPTNQKRAKSAGKMDQKKKSDTEKEKQDDGHVNPYMDEWLGVKKKEVDGRYKPGKPPPNRIFISSEISKSKLKAQVAKFSDMFLTETIALQKQMIDPNVDVTPESQYGIISDKQRDTFKTMFNEIDKDKNGSVTLEELKLKMMPMVSRDDIKHFVQVFDLNKDQTVDSREFTAICCLNDRLAGTRTETADGSIALELEKLAQHIVIFKEMYKTMDEDDDNRLDVNEVLVMVSAAMETEMGSDMNDARRVLSAARDEFGYIDFVGFMSYIPFFAKLLKAIMQNPLSITEIEKARERVKQKELTFNPKKVTKKEPKSWEAY